jgi:hypothetical protein
MEHQLNSSHPLLGRIRELTVQMQKLEARLTSKERIPMAEQAKIHGEIKRLCCELQNLDARVRLPTLSSK